MTAILQLVDISKAYGTGASEVHVISNASVTVETGDSWHVLADEPTGALDSLSSESVMRLLRSVCSNGVGGLVVTHDAQLASWADRVAFVRDGKIIDQTTAPVQPESFIAPSAE